MRVPFYLVALVVGVNPISGKPINFGNMSEVILFDLPFVSAQYGCYLWVDQRACLSESPSLAESNPILAAAVWVFGDSKVVDYIAGGVSHPPFFRITINACRVLDG